MEDQTAQEQIRLTTPSCAPSPLDPLSTHVRISWDGGQSFALGPRCSSLAQVDALCRGYQEFASHKSRAREYPYPVIVCWRGLRFPRTTHAAVSTQSLLERESLRAERARLTHPFDRIAFDNRPSDRGICVGLVLMAFADDDNEAWCDLGAQGGMP